MNTTPIQTNQSYFGRLGSAALAFVGAPASPRPLAFLRIGLASVLLVQALAIGAALSDLYGPRGFIPWEIVNETPIQGMPRLSWVVDALASYGVGAETCVRGVFLLYVASLACLLIGWHTRVAAVVAWLTHLALKTTANNSIYGVDQFASIALFYCAVMPVGHFWSADRELGRVTGAPSSGARLGLRVLQLHMCVIYFTSGLEKAAGEQWWNGEAIWRAVLAPTSSNFDFTWMAWAPQIPLLLGLGTLALEVGYAFLVWPQRTRKLMILATVSMHLGIAVAMGLWSFSAVMIVLNLSAFWFSPEPAKAPASRLVPLLERCAA